MKIHIINPSDRSWSNVNEAAAAAAAANRLIGSCSAYHFGIPHSILKSRSYQQQQIQQQHQSSNENAAE